MKNLSKKTRHEIYNKTYEHLKECIKERDYSFLCPLVMINHRFVTDEYIMGKSDLQSKFPELFLFDNNKGIWFDNDEQRLNAILLCIEMTK